MAITSPLSNEVTVIESELDMEEQLDENIIIINDLSDGVNIELEDNSAHFSTIISALAKRHSYNPKKWRLICRFFRYYIDPANGGKKLPGTKITLRREQIYKVYTFFDASVTTDQHGIFNANALGLGKTFIALANIAVVKLTFKA